MIEPKYDIQPSVLGGWLAQATIKLPDGDVVIQRRGKDADEAIDRLYDVLVAEGLVPPEEAK